MIVFSLLMSQLTVCHNKLLFKLSRYGVSGLDYKWIGSVLLGRDMNVRVNNALSEPVSVRSGIPQGSVLGPLLYLCCSADLQHVVNHSTISMYATDSKLYRLGRLGILRTVCYFREI